MRKHRDRKKKKQKEKQGKTKGVPPSTMQGPTGQLKDAYAEMIVNQVNQSLDLMHTNGIPVKEDAVRRGSKGILILKVHKMGAPISTVKALLSPRFQ